MVVLPLGISFIGTIVFGWRTGSSWRIIAKLRRIVYSFVVVRVSVMSLTLMVLYHRVYVL